MSTGSTLFTASASQRLQVADGSQLVSAAGQAMTVGGWFKFASLSAQQVLFVKDSFASVARVEYGAYFHPAGIGVTGGFGNGTTSGGSGYANDSGLVVGSWAFIVTWYDPAGGGTINTQVNNGTPTSAAFADGVAPLASLPFTVGYDAVLGLALDARVASLFVHQRATAYTSLERTWLYNAGSGRFASELGVGGTDGANLIPAAGKGDWWDLTDSNASHTGAFRGVVLASTDSGGPTTPTHSTDGIPGGAPPPSNAGIARSFPRGILRGLTRGVS